MMKTPRRIVRRPVYDVVSMYGYRRSRRTARRHLLPTGQLTRLVDYLRSSPLEPRISDSLGMDPGPKLDLDASGGVGQARQACQARDQREMLGFV